MKKIGNPPGFSGYPIILKFLFTMKLAIVIILATCLQVSAHGYSQNRISLRLNSVDVSKALSQIERKSSFRFLYNQSLVSGFGKVELIAENEEVTSILDKIFGNTGVSYQLLANNLVVLKERNKTFNVAPITGRVVSSSGEPIAGASIEVKGTTSGTSSDASGNFSLTIPEGATLVVSAVGFTTQEIKPGTSTVLNIVLQASTSAMDEVVVIGYGTASKRDLTGSIVKIEGKEVADKPNTNAVSSLQGKVAGLSVVNNGTPGQQPDVRIRGTISINQVHPLYVVDGIFQDNIDYINPNDIESMEILKDPSSLAIFGVRGAAGVIAITTKRAKSGQVIVNFNTTAGSKTLVDKIQLASGQQFRQILTQEGMNQTKDDAGDLTISNFVNNDLSKWTGNTDWVEALTRTAVFNTNNLSVSATTDKNKFYMGVGYTYDEGLVKHIKYERMNINLADELRVSKTFRIGFNFNGIRESLPYDDGNGALNAARQIFPIVNDGTKSYFVRDPYKTIRDSSNFDLYSALPVLQNSLANPLMGLENKWNAQKNYVYRGIGSVFAELTFLRNFTFRTTLYADISTQDKRTYTPLYDAYDPGAVDQSYPIYRASNLSKVEQDVYAKRKFQGDYILTYKKNFGEHSFNATAGWTHVYNGNFLTHGEVKQKSGDDPIPNNPRFWYITSNFGDPTTRVARSKQFEWATISALGRILYNYQGKYYLNVSYRRDASSGISDRYKDKWQDFWAVGAAWELTREDFMANQNIFNFLKLKASAGVLGNANLGERPYGIYPTISSTASAVFGNNIVPSYSADYLASNLKWESVHSQEIGFEFAAFRNRLNGEINYYNKTTKDLLQLNNTVGVRRSLAPNGSINNKGLEFTLGWTQRLSSDVVLNVSGNLTTFKNKVLDLGIPIAADVQTPNQTITGKPIGYFYGYIVEGLYQNQEDIDKSPENTVNGGQAKPGDFKYKDLDGNGKIDELDRTQIGNPTPDFAYGISASLNFKGFDLGLDLGGVSGNEIYRVWGTSEQKNSVYNYPAYYADAWNGEGTSNSIPIVNAKHLINRAPSTYGIENGSYMRIRNLTLGYNFNTKMLSRASIKNLRVYVNVQNLKTWKHNIGYSPEYGGTVADQAIAGDDKARIPSATAFGIDRGDAQGALPRVITGGINITF